MPIDNCLLEIKSISQHYSKDNVIDGMSLCLKKGEIGCLLGPSGCGKTTILRCIAGFENITDGHIRIDGDVISSSTYHKPVEHRNIGMVFQDYALFPHLNIKDNIAFGLKNKNNEEIKERIEEVLTLVDLNDFQNMFPHEISGGQQQRVALARALAPKPQLLLLDEPFSNLDISLRERLCMELRDILKKEGMTALLITHDQNEAFMIADVVGVMDSGQVKQWDSPYNIYHEPINRHIAEFIGDGAFISGTVIDNSRVKTEAGIIRGKVEHGTIIGDKLQILLRPDDVVHNDNSSLQAKIIKKSFRGAQILYNLELSNGEEILSLAPSHHNHDIGDFFGYQIECDHIIAF